MEKKKYIAPECEVIEMEIMSMIATSTDLGIGGDIEESDPNDMVNKHRGEWGDLWSGRR
jgi:hypothetical protein